MMSLSSPLRMKLHLEGIFDLRLLILELLIKDPVALDSQFSSSSLKLLEDAGEFVIGISFYS